MSSSSLENEDLDSVHLVRMEDVQPSRDRPVEPRASPKVEELVYETCIIDDIEYENECIVNDEDSNIGSMVSLQSEDVYEDDSSSQELIVPEVLDEVETENDEEELELFIQNQEQGNPIAEYIKNPIGNDSATEVKLGALQTRVLEAATGSFRVTAGDRVVKKEPKIYVEVPKEFKVNPKEYVIHAPVKTPPLPPTEFEVPLNKVKRIEEVMVNPPSESWPTLEILPGGVIKNTDKYESDSSLYTDKVQETVVNTGEMMYACAKCSQTFKYLFCLVKHVKWHEDQMKILKNPNAGKITESEQELINIKRERIEIDKMYKKQKLEVLSRKLVQQIHMPTFRQEEDSS